MVCRIFKQWGMTGFSRESGPDMAQLSALRAQDLRQMVAADGGPDSQQNTACNPDTLEQEVSRSAETRIGPQRLGQTSVPVSAMHLCSAAPEWPSSLPGIWQKLGRFSPLNKTLGGLCWLIFASPAASPGSVVVERVNEEMREHFLCAADPVCCADRTVVDSGPM